MQQLLKNKMNGIDWGFVVQPPQQKQFLFSNLARLIFPKNGRTHETV